jgi:hypothetical protein
MDPGTAAILTLSAITGISGYGAMKLNAKAKGEIDEQIKNATAATQQLLTQSQEARKIAEDEVKRLTKDIKDIEGVKKQLETDKAALSKEKTALSQNLDSATELENTYRALSPEAFKQAITDFKDNDAIKKLEHPEFFEPLLSRFSMSRGTAQSLYTKFANAVDGMMTKADFDELLLDTLKNADRSLEQAKAAKAKADEEAKATAATEAAEAKTKKDTAAAEAKRIKDEAAAAVVAAKAVKEAKTLQQIVDEAFEAAKSGPLTSNTTYQSIKTPFLSGVDSVARGVQKAVDVTKQAAKKTGEVIRAPLTQYEQRQKRYKEALEQQGGAGDTFDTDVYYRLFHPKDEDRPNKVLAKLFEKTSTDSTLARNILPVFDAFMYWRKTVLNSPILYKVELVASAQNLFKLVEPSKVNAVFQNKDLAKAMEAVKPVGTKEVTTRLNPMTGRTADAADIQAVKDAKVEPVKEFKETIDEPPKEAALTLRTPKGGMRKKKLRTRRRDKQNVRRTRRSQNRPNRTDTYSSRRSEVDASGDELGL